MRHISKEKRIMNELTSIKFVKCGNCPESCKILVVLPSIKIQNKNVDTRIKYSETRQTLQSHLLNPE
jgi:hypothetical protein